MIQYSFNNNFISFPPSLPGRPQPARYLYDNYNNNNNNNDKKNNNQSDHNIIADSNLTMLESEYASRLQLWSDECDRHTKHVHNSSHEIPLVYVPKYNFSYCMISKTGTTTFLSQLKKSLSLKRSKTKSGNGMQMHFRSKFDKAER